MLFMFFIIVLISQKSCLKCYAILLQCPLHQMQLEKIVGFRPPSEYLNNHNLLFTPLDRSIYTIPNQGIRVKKYAFEENFVSTISFYCWNICHNDSECIAYVHILNVDECYGFSYLTRTQHYYPLRNNLPLVPDSNSIFYEKSCLSVPETCNGRLWALTRIPGSSLVMQGKKIIPMLVTRRECAEKCLLESEFQCLSASFVPSKRNNYESRIFKLPEERLFHESDESNTVLKVYSLYRLAQYNIQHQQHYQTKGQCILSDKDKTILPKAFRAAPFNEEYIENQCHKRAIQNNHCSYEHYSNSSFIYPEIKFVGLTQNKCKILCTNETKFYCRGASYFFEGNITRSLCSLHSEDMFSMGPRSLRFQENSVFMHRVKCLEVLVTCTKTEMVIKYKPKDWFHGKMYTKYHPTDCFVTGNGTQSTELHLQIGSEAIEKRCGVLRAYEATKLYKRTFISALIVIQNNVNVQTQSDRILKAGCIVNNINISASSEYYLSEENDKIPIPAALESPFQFPKEDLPSEDFFQNNNSFDLSIFPRIKLQIIDLSFQNITKDVEIGQNLELQIIADHFTARINAPKLKTLPPLDFQVTSLIAKTLDTQNQITLIDERGCPTDISIFPALERIKTCSQNILRAPFQAFKFAGTNTVIFNVKVHFCPHQCRKNNCLLHDVFGRNWQFHKQRNRRQVNQKKNLTFKNNVYISSVINSVDDKNSQNILLNENHTKQKGLALVYNLQVRKKENSNSVMYGEHGLLFLSVIENVSHLDDFCVNQYLFITLSNFLVILHIFILFWLLYCLARKLKYFK